MTSRQGWDQATDILSGVYRFSDRIYRGGKEEEVF